MKSLALLFIYYFFGYICQPLNYVFEFFLKLTTVPVTPEAGRFLFDLHRQLQYIGA